MFEFIPQLIFILIVACIVVFLVWKFPKSKEKQMSKKKSVAVAKTAQKSKVSDIKVSQTEASLSVEETDAGRGGRRRRIKDATQSKEENVGISVSKKSSRKVKKSENIVDLAPQEEINETHDERVEALKTKKEMHQNVLKVIDRVAHLAKRAGELAKSGAMTTIAFVRKQQARLKRRNMTPAQINHEKVLDSLEKAALSLGAGELSKAEKSYIGVVGLDPRNVRAYKGLAEVYEKQGNFDHAIASLEQVLKIDALDADAEKKLPELRKLRLEKKMREDAKKSKKK